MTMTIMTIVSVALMCASFFYFGRMVERRWGPMQPKPLKRYDLRSKYPANLPPMPNILAQEITRAMPETFKTMCLNCGCYQDLSPPDTFTEPPLVKMLNGLIVGCPQCRQGEEEHTLTEVFDNAKRTKAT